MSRLVVGSVLLVVAGCQSPGGDQTTAGVIPPAIRYDQHIAVEGRPPAGAEPSNPFAGNPRTAEAGRQLFTSMNCDGCHGGGATGFIGPSLSDGRWRYGASDGAIYQSIYYGRPQGMPAYGGVLEEPVVWQLVTYLKSLPVPAAVPTQAW